MKSTFNIKKYLKNLILILMFVLPISTNAQTKNLVNIYFFYSEDCTHCHSEIKFLDSLEEKYNNVNIYRYEVHNQENNRLRLAVIDLYQLKGSGVPLTVIGDTVYLGYTDTSSNLKFIKTIEYYSKYGYQDRVGELLQIESLPTYQKNNLDPILEDFLDTYGNYQLIGSFYTDDIDTSSTAIILGGFSQFNLIKLIFLIIVWFLTIVQKHSNGLIYILLYVVISYLLTSVFLIFNSLYAMCLSLTILALSILNLIHIFKTKHQKYFYILILVISIISNTLANIIYQDNFTIFKELIYLHNLTGLNKLSYYANYLSICLIINVIYILIYILFNSILLKRMDKEMDL